MTLFPRNRYRGDVFLAALAVAQITVEGDDYAATLVIGDEEVDIYSPTLGRSCDAFIAEAKAVLAEVTALDNLVQASCEREHAHSGLAARNFEVELAHITIDGPELALHYHGTRVNTEWTAQFQRVDGTWCPANFSS